MQTAHFASLARLCSVLSLVCCLAFGPAGANAQDKEAYALYTGAGKRCIWTDLLKAAKAAQYVCFGEEHNNAIAHWLQHELLTDLAQHNPQLIFSLEMLESDQQDIMDQWTAGKLNSEELPRQTRVWPNFATDYLPALESAKARKLQVLAANCPRKYARIVAQNGPDALMALGETEKKLLAPLPLLLDTNLKGYKHMMQQMRSQPEGIDPYFFAAAQALKDATMAYRIQKAATGGKQVLHLNGNYHSDNQQGVVWYIKQTQPKAETLTISTVSQDYVGMLEGQYKGLADFILVVPSRMTRTY